MIDDSELDTRLRKADRGARLTLNQDAYEEMLHISKTRKRHSPKRLGLGVGGIIAAVALAFGATQPAVADLVDHFLAQTPWFCQGTECGQTGQTSQTPKPLTGGSTAQETRIMPTPSPADPSLDNQYVDASAPDFAEYAVTQYPAWLQLPASFSIEDFRSTIANGMHATSIRNDYSSLISNLGIRREYEYGAQCAWLQDWMAADSKHDLGQRDFATAVYKQSSTWPAIVATDGGGVAAHISEVAAQADAGNRNAVEREYSEAACAPLLNGDTGR